MGRRIKNLIKRQLFSIYKLGTRLGVHILPVHYYSTIPNIVDLERTKSIWAKKSELPGLVLDLEQQVQTVFYEDSFAELGKNDLLFIDSSHVVKPGCDVNHLILEILPKLNAGVIVQFHDIYLPYDYQRSVMQTFFHWMETSLLRAFLIHKSG